VSLLPSGLAAVSAALELGRRSSQWVALGGDRREQRGLSGDSRHLRSGRGGLKQAGGFLKHLKECGLTGVQLIISDACLGLVESAAEFFPEAWQRCIVHWYRNASSHVPSSKVREVAAMLKTIHAGEDIEAARQHAVRVIEKLRGLRLTTGAELVATTVEETLPITPSRRIRLKRDEEKLDESETHCPGMRPPNGSGWL
jgi:hypothetical protein